MRSSSHAVPFESRRATEALFSQRAPHLCVRDVAAAKNPG
jgi:hypothetical protein